MKTALALLLLTIPALAAGPAGDKDVLAAMDSWKQALLKGDAAALDRIYHKDLTYTHSSGKTELKAESIANSTRAGNVVKGVEFKDTTTRVYGTTAIVKTKIDLTNAQDAVTHL